jgi:hypothetical protein
LADTCDGLLLSEIKTGPEPFCRKMSPRWESLFALIGDEALKGGIGDAGVWELIDIWRTRDVGDAVMDDMDWRWTRPFVRASSLIDAERGRSGIICEMDGIRCSEPGDAASFIGESGCIIGSLLPLWGICS